MTLLPRFRAAAAAEAVANVLLWSKGIRDRHSLLKIIYMAERKALEELRWPILFDHMKCMRYGMVPQATFDLIQGNTSHPEWEKYIEPSKADHVVYLKSPPRGNVHLSPAQAHILHEAYEENASKSFRQLTDESHDLPEWEDPGQSAIPRSMEEILEHIGLDEGTIQSLLKTMACERQVEDIINGHP
jgi:hypothetical protein